MKNQTRVIEKIKDVILVVLLFSAVLLLYFLWYGKLDPNFIFNEQKEQDVAISLNSVIIPREILISKGGKDFTINVEDRRRLWNDYMLPEVEKFCAASTVVVEEISKEQYYKVAEYNAAQAVFSYSMPFLDFCRGFKIKEWQGFDKIEGFDEIGFSEGSTESIFLSDSQKGKYYRLVGNYKTALPQTIKDLAKEENLPTYYQINTLLGSSNGSKVFLPIEPPKLLHTMVATRDLERASEKKQDEIAERYFGNSFDFVRKVRENDGTVVYMYGYGKIRLTLDASKHYLEYKKEPELNTSATLIESLSAALKFIGQKHCFESIDGEVLKLRLYDIYQISGEQTQDSKKSGYRFEFASMQEGYDIFYKTKPSFAIEVINGQVTYVYRNLIGSATQVNAKERQGTPPIEVIVENHELLAQKLAQKGKEQKLNFEDITDEIREIQYGYLKTGDQLVPAWRVKLSANLTVYFDAQTGKEIV